ncbi:MAG: copper-binding protein [Acidobacteria bacterium]|nr:copper-binding protein [Acidobacteriota bacterium]
MNKKPTGRLLRFVMTAPAVAFIMAGCGPTIGPLEEGQPLAVPSRHRYTVRGEIYQLPDPASPGSALMIRHEAIPDFVNQRGKRVGMKAMTMAFEPAPGLSWPDLQVGDKVEFHLRVDWERSRYEIVELRKLPPDTPLTFGR